MGVVVFHAWLPSATRLDKEKDKEIKYVLTEIKRKEIPFPSSIYLYLESEGIET